MGKNNSQNNDDYEDEDVVVIDDHGQIITLDDPSENRRGIRPPRHTFF